MAEVHAFSPAGKLVIQLGDTGLLERAPGTFSDAATPITGTRHPLEGDTAK